MVAFSLGRKVNSIIRKTIADQWNGLPLVMQIFDEYMLSYTLVILDSTTLCYLCIQVNFK